MNPGDEILVTLNDTARGLKVLIQDLTTGKSGFMVASGPDLTSGPVPDRKGNGFAQVIWEPDPNAAPVLGKFVRLPPDVRHIE
jgi:hypothetical protein